MHIYKTFFKVMKQYKMSLFMYSAIIIFMLVALANVYEPDTSAAVVQSKYTLLIEDKDKSQVSEEFVKYMGSRHTLKKGDFSDDQIKDLLYYQEISEYIVIPQGFGDKLTELSKSGAASEAGMADKLLDITYDEALPRGSFINMQIDQYLNAITNYMSQGMSLDDASEKAADAMDITKYTEIQKKDISENEPVYARFLFLPFGILTIIFSGVIPVIMAFNEKEKKNRTIISSKKLTSRNLSLALASATLSIAVTCILIALAGYKDTGKIIFTGPWWLAVGNAFVYTLTITMLLSMITSLPLGITSKGTTDTVSFVTIIIGLSFAFLGGTFVDVNLLGDKVAAIGKFLPNYWYSIASRKIWLENGGLADVLGCYGLQLLFGAVCLAIGLGFTRFFGEKESA